MENQKKLKTKRRSLDLCQDFDLDLLGISTFCENFEYCKANDEKGCGHNKCVRKPKVFS